MENQENQRTKLREWLNVDKVDLNSTINKKLENTPSPSSVTPQNRLNERNKIPNEELIKYMSILPSYLEKGDNLREKALSFGVLDWKRLEKWQNNRKYTVSPSSSNNSSFFSTDISSARSSIGQSCSSAETAVKEIDKFKEKSVKLAKREQTLRRKYQSFNKLQEIKPNECRREDIQAQSKVDDLEKLGSGINRNIHEKGKNKALIDDFESNHRGGIKKPSSNIKLTSESFEYPSHSSKYPIRPSRGKNIEDKPKKIIDRSEPKIEIIDNHILSKSSPNRMFSFGLNKSSRRSSSLDLSSDPFQPKSEPKKDINYLSSNFPNQKIPSPTRSFSFGLNRFGRRSSSLDFSNVPNLSSENDPYISHLKKDAGNNDKPNVGRKSDMSPLRRFWDPLLKPKAVNTSHSGDLSKKDLEKIYLPNNDKNKPSKVQALVQMSIKNGLPLYTFADDKTNGVLAATVKKATALKKGENSWIYTFFNVDEVKKKNSWMNKARKGETHGYVPSVIAQMRVIDNKYNPVNIFSTREFVSFSVHVSEDDQQTSNFRAKDELAAIIVKFPKEGPSNKDKFKRGDDYLNDPIFITAVLPGGNHGIPSKGKPSPLIERWKSGGLCDCGGWDLGCRLKVLTSEADFIKRSIFSQAADVVELFPQGEIVEDRPVFVLSPFKDNIYSVEFDSSITFLQAFSICISILNCRKPYDLSELSKLFEDKEESAIIGSDVTKAPNPPLSPVSRV